MIEKNKDGETYVLVWVNKGDIVHGNTIYSIDWRYAGLPKIELIQKDHRGASYQLLFPDDREAVLIFTKAGFYRGGHSHSKPEVSLILSGRLRNWKRIGDLEVITEKIEGEFMVNQPGEPHVTLALADFWLIDWKIDSKIGESVTTNYPPYRKFVDEQRPKP